MVSTTSSRSAHTSDPILQPFLTPTFDPTTYLNSTLPSLTFVVPPSRSHTLSLPDLAAQTQSHVTQLSAQTSRLTATLTSLTDDILRSGSRLAYEVEVLRGEAISLSETLTQTLKPEIEKFVPGGVVVSSKLDAEATSAGPASPTSVRNAPLVGEESPPEPPDTEPESLASLRTLHHVRASLQRIIAIFDAALSWPLPPSLLSISSSFISVSSPSTQQKPSLEAAGQEAAARLKSEIGDLLAQGPEEGVLAAEKRVDELKELVGVWRGTVEEKARAKFVDGLARTVAERRKEVEGKGGLVGNGREARSEDEAGRDTRRGTGEGRRGFLRNLQRLREEIYLE